MTIVGHWSREMETGRFFIPGENSFGNEFSQACLGQEVGGNDLQGSLALRSFPISMMLTRRHPLTLTSSP